MSLTEVWHLPHYTSRRAFQQLKTQMDMFSFHKFHQEHPIRVLHRTETYISNKQETVFDKVQDP